MRIIADDQRNLANDMLDYKNPFDFRPGKPEDGWLRFRFRQIRSQSAEFFEPTLIILNGFGEEDEILSETVVLRRI